MAGKTMNLMGRLRSKKFRECEHVCDCGCHAGGVASPIKSCCNCEICPWCLKFISRDSVIAHRDNCHSLDEVPHGDIIP